MKRNVAIYAVALFAAALLTLQVVGTISQQTLAPAGAA